MEVKLIIFNKDIIMPERAHPNDAGIDVYLIEKAILWPHETIAIPLGFGLEVPIGMMACVFPRSSITKNGIISHLPPIDSGYTGEIHAIITNTTNNKAYLESGTKIGQLIFMPIALPSLVIKFENERGDGAFGSTDQ